MPLNPQAKQVADLFNALGITLMAETGQALRDQLANFPRAEGEVVGAVEDRTVPGPGGPIPVRIYTPAGKLKETLPALVWFHGGGWVIGNLDGADFSCRMMCNAFGGRVISVDYRLAPENKYPAAADDCYAVTKHVYDNAAAMRVDAKRIAVGGDSAGGNLAAVVSQMAKASGDVEIAFQLLVYPVTNFDFTTPSYTENESGYLLSKASMVWFWDQYLRTPADGADPKASPLRAKDLSGLPPALVYTCEYDPLRDEGEAYADALRRAGNQVESHRWAGQIHGMYGNGAIDDGLEAVRRASKALRAALGMG